MSSSLFSDLPTAKQIMENEVVQQLVGRLNRTKVADEVKRFLGELQVEVEKQRSKIQMPSVEELARQAAQFIYKQQASEIRPVINATGKFFSSPITGTPLSDFAADRIANISKGFSIGAQTSNSPNHWKTLCNSLCKQTSAEAAMVVHSHSAAVWLVCRVLANEQEIVVARGDLVQMCDGSSLPELVATSGAVLKEVGCANHVLANDFQEAMNEQTAGFLLGDSSEAELETLVSIAHDNDLWLVHDCGEASLARVKSCLALGVDLAIVKGDGYLGGPACGIVLGRHEFIQSLCNDPLYAMLQPNLLTAVALEATLNPPQEATLEGEARVEQLLNTPAGNLQHRAERMASQFGFMDQVSTAQAVELPANSASNETDWGVVLCFESKTVGQVRDQLLDLPLPILVQAEPNQVVLNLRTVFPSQDSAIIEAVQAFVSSDR